MRGATAVAGTCKAIPQFQSTLLMRGATRRLSIVLPCRSCISIHAPHARSDATKVNSALQPIFQSTLLMRGATIVHACRDFSTLISIHAPHARSDVRLRALYALGRRISIHAPHARSDSSATLAGPRLRISIHAPHARSDRLMPVLSPPSLYFNPRSSCEERRTTSTTRYRSSRFQSTLLMRGATS